MAEQLDADLSKKLMVINLIWLSCLILVLIAYLTRNGYTLAHIMEYFSKRGDSTSANPNSSPDAPTDVPSSLKEYSVRVVGRFFRNVWAVIEGIGEWMDGW